jgi:hypothetical protein
MLQATGLGKKETSKFPNSVKLNRKPARNEMERSPGAIN